MTTLESMRVANTTPPTPDRPTWLVRFDYSIHIDGDLTQLEVETEHSPTEIFIVSIKDADTQLDTVDFYPEQLADIRAEALQTFRAYDLRFTTELTLSEQNKHQTLYRGGSVDRPFWINLDPRHLVACFGYVPQTITLHPGKPAPKPTP